MEICVTGLNHKSTTLEVRERVAITGDQLVTALRAMAGINDIAEGVILSTCNRTEHYSVVENGFATPEAGARFMSRIHQLHHQDLASHTYFLTGRQAVEHLFRVAGGIDSLVIGEGQVLGQVRQAYLLAREQGVTGPVLDRLFSWALRVGKRARTETSISQGASSVSFAAVELAGQIFGELSGARVLLLGVGKIGELTLKLLMNSGVSVVMVANRTYKRALELARSIGGRAIRFDALDEHLQGADIVITSTGAPHQVLTRERLARVMRNRRDQPLFIIDLAVPRDVDPAAAGVENLHLYNIDDLKEVVESTMTTRRDEISLVEEIIAEEIDAYFDFCQSLEMVPFIRSFRLQIEDLSQEQINLTLARNRCTPEQVRLLEEFRRGLVKRILHHPTVRMKALAANGDADQLCSLVADLFNLDPGACVVMPKDQPPAVDHSQPVTSREN